MTETIETPNGTHAGPSRLALNRLGPQKTSATPASRKPVESKGQAEDFSQSRYAAKKMAEDGRVSMRHVRRDAMDLLKKHGHDSGVTEDQQKQAEKDLQKLTDEFIAKIEAHLAAKEKEITTV